MSRSEIPTPPPQREDAAVFISVIIPAYNAAAYIDRALDSVFAQTFTDFEVIVVNDGSPDTPLLEQSLLRFIGRIRYLKQSNRGPGAARNSAISQMRGKFAAFLDSDDIWLPTHLEAQVKMLEADPSLDLVYADSVLTVDGQPVGHAFGREPQHPPVTFEKLLAEECNVGTSSTVARRETLLAAGLFDEQFMCCEDFDLWLRMIFRGANVIYDPSVHLYHALSPGSLSSNRYVMKKARIAVYEKCAANLSVSPSQRALIKRLLEETEAECQKDLLKQFLHDGEYEQALAAAKQASPVKRNWKMQLTLFGLAHAPGFFRRAHRLYESFLSRRSRRNAVASARKLKLSTGALP